VQGKRGNADVDGVMTRTATIGDVGTVRIELPAGAKKALN
jgi:ribosomal protein S28E/S33